jgi:hypothetical protein
MLFDTNGYFNEIPTPSIGNFGKNLNSNFQKIDAKHKVTIIQPPKQEPVNQQEPVKQQQINTEIFATPQAAGEQASKKIYLSERFLKENFDIFTFRVYAHIAHATQTNGHGLIETVQTTAKKTGMSEVKVRECLDLLDVCKIISIDKKRDNSTIFGVIYFICITHESKWFLFHKFRDAHEFALAKKTKEKR